MIEMTEKQGTSGVQENSVTPINNENDTIDKDSDKNKLDKLAELRLQVGQKITKGISNGFSLQGLLHAQNLDENKKAKGMLAESKAKFERDRYKKWFVAMVGVLIGGFLGYTIPTITSVLTRSMYDRAGLDKLTLDLLPDFKVYDASPDEVLICAYEYNSQQPRFYSKYFARQYPYIYDQLIAKAIAGSSSVPGGFQPQSFPTGYGQDQFILDGMIIGNNPSLYAFIMQELVLNNAGPYRVLSIATGASKDPSEVAEEITRSKWDLIAASELTADVDMEAQNKILKRLIDKQQADLKKPDEIAMHRMQIVTSLSPNGVDKANVDGLIKAGDEMYQNEKESVEALIRLICDEKF